MKKIYKITTIFLLVFSIGFVATYFSVNSTFKKIKKDHLVTDAPSLILKHTYKVVRSTF
jgi:hypothetical protein